MTDQQFYQENLIKCLEDIRHDMEYITNGISHVDKYLVFSVIDRYLDRAKAINEYISENEIKLYHSIHSDIIISERGV